MASDAFDSARSRYREAYDAYHACALLIAQKLERGEHPTVQELTDEARAIAALVAARSALLKAMGHFGAD
jgi:hypothetical protein